MDEAVVSMDNDLRDVKANGADAESVRGFLKDDETNATGSKARRSIFGRTRGETDCVDRIAFARLLLDGNPEKSR